VLYGCLGSPPALPASGDILFPLRAWPCQPRGARNNLRVEYLASRANRIVTINFVMRRYLPEPAAALALMAHNATRSAIRLLDHRGLNRFLWRCCWPDPYRRRVVRRTRWPLGTGCARCLQPVSAHIPATGTRRFPARHHPVSLRSSWLRSGIMDRHHKKKTARTSLTLGRKGAWREGGAFPGGWKNASARWSPPRFDLDIAGHRVEPDRRQWRRKTTFAHGDGLYKTRQRRESRLNGVNLAGRFAKRRALGISRSFQIPQWFHRAHRDSKNLSVAFLRRARRRSIVFHAPRTRKAAATKTAMNCLGAFSGLPISADRPISELPAACAAIDIAMALVLAKLLLLLDDPTSAFRRREIFAVMDRVILVRPDAAIHRLCRARHDIVKPLWPTASWRFVQAAASSLRRRSGPRSELGPGQCALLHRSAR